MLDTFSAPQGLPRLASASSQWVERVVPADARATLEIDLEQGAVEIRSQAENALRILTRVSRWTEGDFDLERTQKGLRLSDRLSWGVLGSLFGRVQVRAWVPSQQSVDVRTGAGSVSARGMHGALALRTAHGALQIEDVCGPVFAVSSSGAISARGVRGEVYACTSDGSIEVEDSEGSFDVRTSAGWIGLTRVSGPVRARSSSGSMYVGFRARPSGELTTSSGSIEVALPADAALELRAHAHGGSVEIDPELSRHASGDARSRKAIVNGGGECLWLRTTGGNIYVRAEPPTGASHACSERT